MCDLKTPELPETAERPESTIEEALAAIRAGKPVIVVDEHDRENEGDFVCAAESMTAETVDFMIRRGRGVLCTPLTEETADRLRLSPIVPEERNTAPHRTPFLVPVDHREAGTGVSPEDRAKTVRALADPRSVPDDFLRPGHVSPLLGKEGGVLRRAGHTEATIDLCRLAGLSPVGVLIEICAADGHGMASYDELRAISVAEDIPLVSIEALIRYRREREKLVTRVAEVDVPTAKYGTPTIIAYRVEHEDPEPIALVWGDLTKPAADGKPPLVRMHSSCLTGDLLDSLRCDCGDQLHMAMSMIHEAGAGAVVYLLQEGRGIGLIGKLKAYMYQDLGLDTVEANLKLGFKADQRDYMVGLQILKDLGLREIRLLTNNPKKSDSFVKNAMDLRVVEQVPIVAPAVPERERYMATKRDRMGHDLPGE